MQDLFETYELIPANIQAILDKYDNLDELTYNECDQMLQEVESEGYTFDYYLDAEPYNLRKKFRMPKEITMAGAAMVSNPDEKYNIGILTDENVYYEEYKKAIPAMINFFGSIDHKLLKEQKEYLLNEAMGNSDEDVQGLLYGVVNMFDAFQDIFTDKLGYSIDEVFNIDEEK